MTRSTLLLSLAAIIAVPTIAARTAPAPHDKPAIEGVWRYRDEIDRRSDGSVFSAGPTAGYDGLLIFTGNGYMSATLVPKGRTWTLDAASPAQLRAAVEFTSAHAGRYEIDPKAHTVRMESMVSLDRTEEGKWYPIQYALAQDTLSLSGPWNVHGEKLTFVLRLTRVK
ncbi:MAG: lipocalin-like domain-containing protein [Gemmatimonadota bacterium]